MTKNTKSEGFPIEIGGTTVIVRVRGGESLKLNQSNSNQGKPRGNAAIAKSLEETGLHRGIVTCDDDTIIAGNHAYEAATSSEVAQAWVEIEIPNGSVGVVTKRADWKTAKDPKAVKAGYYDNRTQALNNAINPVQLVEDLEYLSQCSEPLAKEMFTDQELFELIEEAAVNLLEKEEDDGEEKEPGITCPSCGHVF